MQRSAVFVDAGYLFAQGSVLLAGEKQGRECMSLDVPAAVSAFRKLVETSTGVPLLRIYWYDAIRLGRPTREQDELAISDNIKIRLGQINSAGQQKGVDALIITDLVDLARNHAITDAILLSGDEDVRVGVLLAQQFGVRVHLVGIHPARSNQSRSLMQESDSCIEWGCDVISTFLNHVPSDVIHPAALANAAIDLEAAVQAVINALPDDEIQTLRNQYAEGNPSIPREIDKTLLRLGRQHYGQQTLEQHERSALRTTFVNLIKASSP